MSAFNVVVIGNDSMNTLGVIRSLGENSIAPIAIVSHTGKSCSVTKSKYLKKFYLTEPSVSSIVDKLLEIGRLFPEKAFLFPCGDFYENIIDQNLICLSRYYVLPNIDMKENNISVLMNKYDMLSIAKKIKNITIPKTIFLNHMNIDTLEKEMQDAAIDFPVIIKCGDAFANGRYISKANNMQHLHELLEQFGENRIIIQEFIEKDEELGVQGVSFGNIQKDTYIPGTIHKKRTSVNSIGSTTYAEIHIKSHGEEIEAARSFIDHIGYSGIFDIEFVRKCDKLYFIECNFRNGAYGYAYTKAGYNLPLIWMGQQSNSIEEKSMTLMNGFSDVKHVIHNKLNPFKWLIQFFFADIHLNFNLRDIRPSIHMFFNKL